MNKRYGQHKSSNLVSPRRYPLELEETHFGMGDTESFERRAQAVRQFCRTHRRFYMPLHRLKGGLLHTGADRKNFEPNGTTSPRFEEYLRTREASTAAASVEPAFQREPIMTAKILAETQEKDRAQPAIAREKLGSTPAD
ncbi:hypothetical protein BV898_19935 [Hypsibius exemplaris]|uniref:Uncharacterized protein n=1 Tax=Hypsibius exemplaris TaxID=2072580 RepID=A0A9X6RQ77_HYPEX|nr:hypothetical protein BV898_19935 [Hypsibius exemplaris]